MFGRIICILFLIGAAPIGAFAQSDPISAPKTQCSNPSKTGRVCISADNFAPDICNAFFRFSGRYKLDAGFFARLIWQESRFDPNAKSHADAMGIAQFIASTAKLRKLDDPYNPAQALEASAKYLAELEQRFGNLGLAAAAYNAGETAAANFKAGKAGLPNETWNYVQIITGQDPATWRDTPPKSHDFSLSGKGTFYQRCQLLATTRKLSDPKELVPQYKKWGVQVAAGKSRALAAKSYKYRTRACKRLLSAKRPDYIYSSPQVKLRRPSYVARIGFDARRKANDFCAKLKASNCGCVVYKN